MIQSMKFLHSGLLRSALGIALCVALTGTCLLATGSALAQTYTDPYTVTGIEVDARAANAAAARTVALRNGHRSAFSVLYDRLTLPEARNRLPELDDDAIAGLVRNFGVGEERTSATRYLARMTFTFDREAVQDILSARDIPFSDRVSAPVLVLPVFEAEGRAMLWDRPNPWWDAWSAGRQGPARIHEGLVPVTLPLGDVEDFRALTAEDAAAGNGDRIRAFAARYDAPAVVVAIARFAPSDGADGGRLDVFWTRYDADGAFAGEAAYQSDSGLDPLLESGVATVDDALEEAWKRKTVIEFGAEETLAVRAVFGDLPTWLSIKRNLERSPIVEAVSLQSVSASEAWLQLRYLGDVQQLSAALAQEDLFLEDIEGTWTVSFRTAPSGGLPSSGPASPGTPERLPAEGRSGG